MTTSTPPGGADRISARAGNDYIRPGGGADFVHGGAGDDTISDHPIEEYSEDSHVDHIVCGTGSDTVTVGEEDVVADDCEIVNRY
jgi:Ca2+-binding RTX toxin-like protein